MTNTNANAIININTTLTDISSVFYFKPSTLDISNNTTTNLRVAINNNNLSLALQNSFTNTCNLQVSTTDGSIDNDVSGSGSLKQVVNSLPSGLFDNKELCKDLVRYISYQLTGGYCGTDIFINETGMKNAICNYIKDDITGIKNKIHEKIVNENSILEGINDISNGSIGTLFDNTIITKNILNKEFEEKINDMSFNNWLDASFNITNIPNIPDWKKIILSKNVSFSIKILFKNIGLKYHYDGALNPTGGNRYIGHRSYLLKFHFL